MKIVYVNDQIFPSTETDAEQIMQTISTLSENGAEIDLLLPEKWFSTHKLSIDDLEKHYQLDLNITLRTQKSLFPSFRFFEKYAHAFSVVFDKNVRNADVVYTRNLPTLVPLLLFTKTPVVYETFRPWPDQLFYMKTLFKWINRQKLFLGAVLHSHFAKRSYRRIDFNDNKLFVAHNGYNPHHIRPYLSKKEAREKLNLPMDSQIVVYTGNVSLKKGIGLLLDMAEALPKTLFIIVGSKKRDAVEIRAEKIDNVTIIPWQSFKSTVPFLYAADILIIPPSSAPLQKVGNTVLPIKTFLYLAIGRAIFAPNNPDLTEILADNENAVLVDPDDINCAIDGIKELLNDKEKIDRIGKNAQEISLNLTYLNRSKTILAFIKKRLQNL